MLSLNLWKKWLVKHDVLTPCVVLFVPTELFEYLVPLQKGTGNIKSHVESICLCMLVCKGHKGSEHSKPQF